MLLLFVPYIVIMGLPGPAMAQNSVQVAFFDSSITVLKEGDYFNVRIAKSGINENGFLVIVEVENDLDSDFIGGNQVASYEPRSTSSITTVTFATRDDNIPEMDETFYLRLYVLDSSILVGAPQRIPVTIKANDDAYGVFLLDETSPMYVTEYGYTSVAQIKVKRTVSYFNTITVNFMVNSSTPDAVIGEDVSPALGSVTFQPNQQEAIIQIQIIADDIPESYESFFVTLTSATDGAQVISKTLELVIRFNDAPVRFSNAIYRYEEGPGTISVSVPISRGVMEDGTNIGPIAGVVSVDYKFVSGTADQGSDFNGADGVILFGPGEGYKYITFNILDDTVPEVEESFSIRLSNVKGDAVLYPLSLSVATIIINANDNPSGIISFKPGPQGGVPLLQIDEDTYTVPEFQVLRSAGTFGNVSVRWSIDRDGGASVPVINDVGPSNGTLYFQAGENKAVITLTIVQDSTPEPSQMFILTLQRNSVNGDAKVEGITEARLLIEDSDNYYGAVEFGPKADQKLITNLSPRLLQLSLTSSGGRAEDLGVDVKITYSDASLNMANSSILVVNSKTVTMPAGRDAFKVDFELSSSTFLVIGGEFKATINGVALITASRFGVFHSLTGSYLQTSVFVTSSEANGETGFFNVTNQVVDEPDTGVLQVGLLVSREGLSGMAVIRWSLSGTNVDANDVTAFQGTLTLDSGKSAVILNIGIKADDIPELAEYIAVTLDSIEPSDNQRLRPGLTKITITVNANDNPGGTLQFSPKMNLTYTVNEGVDVIDVIVERTGGDLEEKSVQYSINPNGTSQFFGATNVLVFRPGERELTTKILPKKDGIPELTETYQLVLSSAGSPVVIGERNVINIIVLENDNAYGVIQFAINPSTIYTSEGLAGSLTNVTLPVKRDFGTFNRISVPWRVTPSPQDDLIPPSGVLVFEPGQSIQYLVLTVVNDDIPEIDETYVAQLYSPDNGAAAGTNMEVIIIIQENDNPVEFTQTLWYVTEPQTLNLILVRQGGINKEARVRCRTLDGSASSVEGDYIQIPLTDVIFAVGERQKIVQVVILDDNIPEQNETLTVQLSDVAGDMIVTRNSTATIVILANDDAYGIFNFSQPADQQVEEGSTVFFDILRSRGNFESVRVFWELRSQVNILLAPGVDFANTSGFVDFSSNENHKLLGITPLADGIPEPAEQFLLTLTQIVVLTGMADGNLASLGRSGFVATVRVATSDDPFGRMAFAATSRDLQVAEDFDPGNEFTTMANFVVERRQGTQNQVKVLWEVFSAQLGGNIPTVYDLLFSGQWPINLEQAPSQVQRSFTATQVAYMSGGSGSFVTVSADDEPPLKDLSYDFSLSAWVQPIGNTDGYIVARCTSDGNTHYYSLKLIVTASMTTIQFRMSTRLQVNQLLSADVPIVISDGKWHHILVAVWNITVKFYLDGKPVGSSPIVDSEQLEGPGILLVGAKPPNTELFLGYLQDIRVFMRAFDDSAVKELYSMIPTQDIRPVSGTLTYNIGERSQNFTISSIQDIEEEGQEVFLVLLLDTFGGATLSSTDARTTLTVMKSDNANGLFGFAGDCSPSRILLENSTVTCTVQRLRGDDGSVTVSWIVSQRQSQSLQQATEDFENSNGSVVFLRGERNKTFELRVRDDNIPELDEAFEVRLTSAVSDDGKIGSTNTSGASIDNTRQSSQMLIVENDNPYGYLQFSDQLGVIPPQDIIIAPTTKLVQFNVSEEGGLVPLIVQRAQGTVGTIRTDWRTKDVTAFSEGKSPPDYVGGVGNILLGPGQNYAWVNITVKDNSIPEGEKQFEVELFSPTGGAVLSSGSNKVVVTIEASDGAFGIFQFADTSLNVQATEAEGDGFNIVRLGVLRLGGTIGTSRVLWEVDEDKSDGQDIINQSGNLTFLPGQTSQFIELQVRGDTIPELDEIIRVKLVSVLQGNIGDPLRTIATVTIAANNDPYGRFIIMPSFRPVRVAEIEQDINVTVQRLGGLFGIVQVDFLSLAPNESYDFMPGPVNRASLNDFNSTQGTLSFGINQEFAQFKVHIIDDLIPEEDESIFVRITTTRLIQAAQLNPVPSSPRLGQSSETYGQIIVSANDDANGRLQLSQTNISVEESQPIVNVSVVRTGGNFGEVSVKLRVIDGTALLDLDYIVLSRTVILASGETNKRVAVEIIDDRVPELSEYFTIELTDEVTGGAVVGAMRSTIVTILPSDDPNGVFTFVAQGQTVAELDQPNSVNITVVRTGGTMDTVTVTWEATLDGLPASDDISPSSGSLFFVTNEMSRLIGITVLPDDIPEGTENIQIRLKNVTNGGRIGDQNMFILSIPPNDSPLGTVQLASNLSLVPEDPADGPQTAQVIRSGGVFGSLRVYYSTSVMPVVDLNSLNGGTVFGLFLAPQSGKSSQSGTEVNVSESADPLKVCATACALESSCLSFLYQQTLVNTTCMWYTTSFTTLQPLQGTNFSYYEKDLSRISQLMMNLAKSGDDFSVVNRMSILMQEGQASASIPLIIVNDNIPELDEQFYLQLVDVQVVNGSPSQSDAPLLGQLKQARVVITANDNAFGVFSINNPSDPNNRIVQVQEIDKLAVDLVVERQGGSIGAVSVEWSVSTINRTATYGQDYIADGATLLFDVEQTRRVISVTILDDNIPEDNEELTIFLGNAKGGATISNMNSIKIVILASDNVAGVLSFEKTSVLVNKGDRFQIKVKRTQPASGTVTTNWIIQSKNKLINLAFVLYKGTLIFLPSETEKILNLTAIADDNPEVDEEYSLTLQNITTIGVGITGQAKLDPLMGVVLITIAGSNDPHGVFQLAASSLDVKVQENVGTARLQVDRKYGAIGIVRVTYEAVEGSLKPFGTQRSPANVGQDFVGVSQGFIDIRNGESSGTINITIIDDNMPEIDEVFVVRLLRVTLIDSTNSSLPPRLAINSTEAEVIILANDGAQGIIQFAPDSRIVSVTEQGQTISLTIIRGNGTFGQVSVFAYSQAVSQSTVLGQDYNMTAGEIVFQEGESRKILNITIIDDTEPEPDETFEVILANPSNGALLGQAVRASITILANDVPGGAISFDTVDSIHLREATPNDLSNTKSEILLRRRLGIFGVISVPFTITTTLGQLTNDVSPANGIVIFADRQSTAVLVLEAVNDNEPEVAETFTLTLQAPSGGAILGNITTKIINIDASNSPWGLLQIYVANTRLSSLSIEETFSAVELDVVRSLGNLGRVTVDVITLPGTATSYVDKSKVLLALLSEVNGTSVSDWHQVNVGNSVYLVMLTSLPQDIQLSSLMTSGSSIGTGQSVLYKWQGQLTYMSTFPSDGAAAATSFTISNNTYLVIANGGREGKRQVLTQIYSISEQGQLQIIQNLSTSGASDVEFLTYNSRYFLFVTNSLDDISKSDVNSYLFEWDLNLGRFTDSPKQSISTLYARAVTSFYIDGQAFLAIANYYDRATGSFEISSVVYRMDSAYNLVQHQGLITQGAVSLTYTEAGGYQLLVVANYRQNVIVSPQDSVIYRWDPSARAFVQHQTLPTTRALKVTAVNGINGSAFLIFANEVGNSEVFVWDIQSNGYKSAWKGGPYMSLQPITIRQPTSTLLLLASANVERDKKPAIFEISQVANGSDYVSRRITMMFEPGQTSLRTSVVILSDDLPEDSESFTVALTAPTGGAELGPNNSVSVEILANDDAFGVIEFSPDSLVINAEEREGKDTPVNFIVIRKSGFSGFVSVAWQATGDQSGVGDITPLSGQINVEKSKFSDLNNDYDVHPSNMKMVKPIFNTEPTGGLPVLYLPGKRSHRSGTHSKCFPGIKVDFTSGQSVATITLTIRDDQEPELAEVTYIRLTQIVNAGTTLPSKGAKLGVNTVAVLTVLANDSPYGVVSWERTAVSVKEPDGSNQPVELAVVREQGLQQALRVYYVTSLASQLPPLEQATPGEDFIVTQGFVTFQEGVTRAVVTIIIKPDDIPETAETFLVNLTSVSLVNTSQIIGVGPSVAIGKAVVQVTITENDNAQGFVEFDVKLNIEGRIDVYEEYGRNVTMELPLKRFVGFFGSLTVTWQADPREADLKDFTPASGTVQFGDQQRNASIFITIIDDAIPEIMETFDVKLISVSGDAYLGTNRQVRVAILKNDSPTGLFRFVTRQVETREALNSTDPGGQAILIVQRVQGVQGFVHVQWRLNAEATNDFMPPLENILLFDQGQSEKQIVLQTRPDNILEGREEFTVSLVAADNNADISNTDGDCKVIILPDPGASGTVSILPEFRSVIVGEPGESSPSYTGEVEIRLTRGRGIFGEVVVTWSLTPRDLSSFLQVEGSLKFADLQQTASIILQARDDSIPELYQSFTLQITSASSGATISTQAGEATASVLFAASDYPHGLVEFASPVMVIVSEDQGNVRVTVTRSKGLYGQLQVAYSTSSGTALSNVDFLPAAGILTFQAGMENQIIEINILTDDIPEGPEDFYVNLTSVQLVNDNNNYTMIKGLSLDMKPALGALNTKIVRIDKNDNAEGTIQFERNSYDVKEESLFARLTIVRTGGTYGQVSARFTTQAGTATADVDYVSSTGHIVMEDRVQNVTLNITIIDDQMMESNESFKVQLSNVTGGAMLGAVNIATVVILKSDYPNGNFLFRGPLFLDLPNPATPTKQTLSIERTGGALGQQQVFWRIMGPNNALLQLVGTGDISSVVHSQDVTQGSLTWLDGELGVKQLVIDIKAYATWEVEKSFVVELYRVTGTPTGVGDGEVDDVQGKLTIKVNRFGDPSGVIRFTGTSVEARQVLEPDGSTPVPLVFPVSRRNDTGVIGNIQIYWEVKGVSADSPDVQPLQGSLSLVDGSRDGQITLQILPDDIPELTETFMLVLVKVEGGAQIDTQFNQSTFSIKYNDFPHGEFGLDPTSQSVEVNAADLSRQVKLNFTRFYGTFGSVLLTFNIGYDTTGTDVALSLNTGTVTFTNGSSEVITLVIITGNAFLKLGSTFTVYITDVQYLGSGMTDPPQIKVGYSKTQVAVTALAANTELSFSSDVTFVNEVDQTMTATLFRAGTYGILSIDWVAGYTDLPGNITNGEISPNLGSVNMRHGQEQANITVQVSPKVNKTEAFVLRLPRAPQSFVSGGARLASSRILIRADPSGVIQFDELSLAAQVSEIEGMITLKVLRLYGSEDNIAIYYQTVPGSAQAFLDFQSISSGIINMKPQETVATIQIQIYQDNIPEQTEIFFVNLTNVEKFPTPLQPVLSPRLSTMKSLSQISIMESNDAYGVLSLKPTTTDINESFTNVTLSVIRTGGLFGTISVTVRTVGGGESWTDQIVANINSLTNDTIADVLGKRSSYESATGGMDYEVMNTVIIFQPQESEKAVKITILEDNLPEPRESILVYLTQPTGGARIATGTNIDSGQKGYAVINIAPSDLSNGLIGFAESSKNVHVNEDTSPTLVLKLTRLNAFFGVVKVNWKSKRSLTSTDQDDADLSTQLVNVAGSTFCPAEQSQCDLIVEIKNDDIPEESYTFIVLLTSAETDARLNENSLSATVTIDPSDNVRGLLQFAQNSRVMIVGENARTVRLAVEKVYGQNYEVTVAYNTQQMTQSAEVAGVNVYPALDAQDFRGQTGTLIFPAKTQTIQYIEISLTPVLASDNPLPKQFYITLYSPSSEASVNPNASRAIVRIVREADVPIWTVYSQSGNNSFSSDANIITLIGQLDNLAQKTLTADNILLIEDVLEKVNEEGNQRKLPTEVITAVKNLYCKLLDEAISDARRGRNALAPLLENFAYTFIKDNSCPPAIKDEVTSFQCSAVTIRAGRWNLNQLGGHEFSVQSRGTFAAAQPMPDVDSSADGTKDECVDFHFLDYNSQTWFYTSNGEDNLMNQKVIGFGLKGRPSGSIQNPVKFRIHTPDRRIAARGAKCVYFDEGSKKWVSPSDVCQVKNDLSQAEDDFVDCECTHMTSYAVIATTRDENIVGYTVWFYVICFICMASMIIVVCVHHLCFKNASFSASMNTHFFMAIFFFQLCLVLDAFLSPDEILAYNTEMNNSKCIAMGLFLHYFFLAQFTWMATQAVNLWKVLIMNDEHTDRHYIVFFIMGWGVPLILVAIFYAVTFNIYKYHTSIEVDFIYGDVNNNRDICFITNAYAAIGGILAPVLLVLLLAAIVFVKAYQLAAQWNLYDDLYFGRYNNKEIPLLLTIWGILSLTCLWLALHMIYGFLWMMVLFCICNLILAILVFVLYAVIRNPLLAFIFGPTKASYSVSGEQPDDLAAFPAPEKPFQHYNTNGSVKGSHISLLNDAWENNTTGGRSRMTVRRALPSQVYINPPVAVISPTATIDSDNPDFEELIYALKMGQSMSSSELSRSFDDDMSQLSIILDKYETKRIDIADTHV